MSDASRKHPIFDCDVLEVRLVTIGMVPQFAKAARAVAPDYVHDQRISPEALVAGLIEAHMLGIVSALQSAQANGQIGAVRPAEFGFMLERMIREHVEQLQ